MSSVDLADFRNVAEASLDIEVKRYRTGQKKELNQRLLGKFLIENFDRFKRCVTQSVAPFDVHYPHVMSEIGIVSGRRLFFEVINVNCDVVNIHEVKRGTETSPPTVVDSNLSNALCYQIVDFLLASNAVDQSSKNRDILTVPDGYYVIEFTTEHGGKNKVTTCPPIKAKTFKDALPEYSRWPGLWYCIYPTFFRVCTNTGWHKLNSQLPKFCGAAGNVRAGEYILTLV